MKEQYGLKHVGVECAKNIIWIKWQFYAFVG
jgi:hypothetical protein